jgi:hypothetical protein
MDAERGDPCAGMPWVREGETASLPKKSQPFFFANNWDVPSVIVILIYERVIIPKDVQPQA